MWVVLGGSLVAVALMTAVAWALKLGGAPKIADEAEAVQIAELLLSGFEAGEPWLSLDHQSAAVIGMDGSIALIWPHGANFIARRVRSPAYKIGQPSIVGEFGARVEIDAGERHPVTIHLDSRRSADALTRALDTAERTDRAA